MKALHLLAGLLLPIVLTACGFSEIHEVALRAPEPPSGHTVEIYMGTQAPPRPFYEVALLQVVGHGSEANLADLVKALTTRAALRGCDAVLRVQIDQGYGLAHAFAVCAKWISPAAPSPPKIPTAPGPAPESQPAPEGTSL